MREFVSLVPDRLAHYRVPVFNNIADDGCISGLVVYADLRPDSTGIKKPEIDDVSTFKFCFTPSCDIRVGQRLLLSTGSIKAAVDNNKVLIIWGDAFCPGNWLAVVIAKLNKKKIVFWTHGLYGNEGGLKKWLRCLFYSLADAMLLYGNYSKKLLIGRGFSPDKLFVINNSLDFSYQNKLFLSREKETVRDFEELRLIFVGRLTKVKKLHQLLYAVHSLVQSCRVKVDVVGDGCELEGLVTLCDKLELNECVRFHGSIYDEEVLARLITGADIMVSPGNVGLTAMHSLVYGTPVVSHANYSNQMPEFESIEPGVSGELFEEDNVLSLEESILRCWRGIKSGLITESTCRGVLESRYSLSYQRNVFKECIEKGLGL